MPEPELPAIVDTTTVDPGDVATEPSPFDLAPIGKSDPIPGEAAPVANGDTSPGDGVAPAVDWNNPFG